MGIFESIARALGGLRSLSDAKLEGERESLRQRYVAGEGQLFNDLHRYDEEMVRRANEEYNRAHPEPRERRHREHGWHLPNDD